MMYVISNCEQHKLQNYTKKNCNRVHDNIILNELLILDTNCTGDDNLR